MNRKYNINEVKNIIKDYIVFKKDNNKEEPMFFKYTNGLIHVFNSHFSSYISLNDFLTQFKETMFYLYKEKNDDELEENKSYYRQ